MMLADIKSEHGESLQMNSKFHQVGAKEVLVRHRGAGGRYSCYLHPVIICTAISKPVSQTQIVE